MIKVTLIFCLLTSHLLAASDFLKESQVKEAFHSHGITETFLFEQASKFEDSLTLETVIKMHKSNIAFKESSYLQVINSNKLYRVNSSSRRLVIDLLNKKNAQIWFDQGRMDSVLFVENDYHRKLALHFTEALEKLPNNLRDLGDEFPTYFLNSEASIFYKNLNTQAALDLVTSEFNDFPSRATIKAYQEKSFSFINNIDLTYVQNDFNKDFVKLLLKNQSKLIEIQKTTGLHPFRAFMNKFDRMGNKKSYETFKKVLDKYLNERVLDNDLLNSIPHDCSIHYRK